MTKKINYKKLTIKELAGIISAKLSNEGIDNTLVGGACVSIYSKNKYQSYDLDYVVYEDMKLVEKILGELNFIKKGKYFEHKECPYFIEFVSPPVAIGNEPLTAPTAKANGIPNSQRAALQQIIVAESSTLSKG